MEQKVPNASEIYAPLCVSVAIVLGLFGVIYAATYHFWPQRMPALTPDEFAVNMQRLIGLAVGLMLAALLAMRRGGLRSGSE
ncbi:hypothetical protein [Celerinatantimonas yamalensis]|uniref:Uncharacterized protein n=1 Tax=Celerinatantimonas yamalensis TaxID=559956 RepID=A0ABW9G9Y8_9GAMM